MPPSNDPYAPGDPALPAGITERRRTDRALRDSDELYRGLFNASADCLVLRDAHFRIVDVNAAFVAESGFSREEAIGYEGVLTHNEEESRPLRAAHARALAGEALHFETTGRRKDGSPFVAEVRGVPLSYRGRPHVLYISRNITERKQAEQALRDSEALYRGLFNASADAMVLRDADYRVVDVNPAYTTMSGYTREETLGADHARTLSPADNRLWRAVHQRMIAGETMRFEFAATRKDGTPYEMEVQGMRIIYHGRPHVLYTSRDITERKRGERALRASEEQYRAIFNASADSMVLRDARFSVVDVNPAYTQMTGYTREETLGAERVLTQTPEGNARQRLFHARVLAGEQLRFETTAQRRDGTPFDAEVRAMPVMYRGEPHVLYVARDITEHKRAESALRTSEAQYRAIFNASADPMVVRDEAMRVVDVNDAFTRQRGLQRADIVGKPFAPPVQGEQLRASERLLHEALHGKSGILQVQASVPGGSLLDIEVRAMPMEYHGKPHVLTIARDMTARRAAEREQRRLEAQLRQAQKMEAIGHLTGGIAHDFNNILASIMGYNVLAVERALEGGDGKIAAYLEEALASCRRARDLIQQMLTFSRGSRAEPRPLRLPQLVHDSIPLLRSSLATSIAFEIEADDDAPPVQADEVQVGQVLLNLCINARDAMAGSGTLHIAVRARNTHELTCTSCRTAVRGQYVEVAVADTGTGIEPKVLDRMFEPFFSTKDKGKGTGMGLAMVHGIVHEHGGHIVVDSKVGHGSTFRVLLPALAADVDYEFDADTVRMPRPKQMVAGRVLLVDDEASVRGFMQEMLAGWGLDVTAAADADQALRSFDAASGAYDLVITDLAMPVKSGIALAADLRVRRRELPIILCSGYADDAAAAEAQRQGVHTLLRKPIEPTELRAAVDAALRGSG